MERLNKDIENEVAEFYTSRNGFLVNISDHSESERISVLIDGYCDDCELCLAGSPVVSLGEVRWKLWGSGLFAVGLLDIKDKEKCSLYLIFKKKDAKIILTKEEVEEDHVPEMLTE